MIFTSHPLNCRRLLFALGLLAAPLAAKALTVTDLKCEDRRQPLGLDAAQPRLSWILHSTRRSDQQTGYQILVASSSQILGASQGDLWDSGKVDSSASLQVVYPGKPLESRQACHWKVRVWDRVGTVSDWSQPAVWEMGLLSPDDWQAQWLNDGKANPQKDADFYREDPAPLFRRQFSAPKPIQRARLFIAGLGYYEATLNGARVGDQVLEPGWTCYSKRVLYSTYDVTRQLAQGENCLGVTVGNGWYNPLPLRMWGHLNLREHLPVGRPRFIARLEIDCQDGTRQTIVSDPQWKVGESPVRFNSIYLGEIYDARKEVAGWDRPGFADAAWRAAALAPEPIGSLVSPTQPPIRVIQTLKPGAMSEPRPGVFIFDLGRNFAGWANLKIAAPAGTRIALRYGELLNKDGTLNPMTSVCGQIKGTRKTKEGQKESVGGPGAPAIAWQGDTYITRGSGLESYTPRFTFHAFRYVEVSGGPGKLSPDAIIGLRLTADVERIGRFACSDERFNRIQEMCDWTFLSNLLSVQSDCPHRERFGYGGDIAATSEAFLMNYDMAGFYAKAVCDWKDSALEDGMLTDTAPFVGIQYCGPAWALAHPLLQRQIYQYCGNRRLIEQQYATAKRWLELVASQNPKLIVEDGLSDHEALASAPAPVMVTPLYAAAVRTVGELAAILGRGEDSARFEQLAGNIRTAYLNRFLEKSSGKIGPGTQASQAFSLYWNLLPVDQRPAALRVLLDDIRGPNRQHLSTGIFGTKYALDVLSREGHADLACAIATNRSVPGWGYMLDGGATTLWEHWQGSDNTFSLNHPMFGSVSQWFFHWLGGLQPTPDAVGFDRIIIRPQITGDLTWVTSSYNSVRGTIVSRWRHERGQTTLEIEVPVGARAEVFVPAKSAAAVIEGGQPVLQSEHVKLLREDRASVVFEVGSGHYEFTAKDN